MGNRVRELRERRGLSLRDLATATGFDYTLISKIEGGKVRLGLHHIEKLAPALGCRAEDLISGRGVPKGSERLALGKPVDQPSSPEEAVLDPVPNPHPGTDYVARFTCPEFTSLCPVTGQPDFAHLVIDYVPGEWLVESKSLKLFLHSFRNHGAFHEGCTVDIAKRIVEAVKPRWLRIAGYWYPRGGIPIDVFWQTGEPPSGIWSPPTGVEPYRGRG